MRVRMATADDVELLVQLRMDFLADGGTILPPCEIERTKRALTAYFMKHISGGQFTAIIAQEGEEVCSSAFLSVIERPPRSGEYPFLTGTVYNVYTYPKHRRKGYAMAVMHALIKEAEGMGVSSVDLLATEDGKPLYEKIGFAPAGHTFMRRKRV